MKRTPPLQIRAPTFEALFGLFNTSIQQGDVLRGAGWLRAVPVRRLAAVSQHVASC